MPERPDGSPPGNGDDEQERGRLAAVLAARRETLRHLQERGVPAFALRFDKDADAADILREFSDALQPQEETGQIRRVAGRVVLVRRHGGVAFVVIRDRSGDLQLFCSRDTMSEDAWALLDDLDLGDIVGAVGPVVKTKRGEVSVKTTEIYLDYLTPQEVQVAKFGVAAKGDKQSARMTT